MTSMENNAILTKRKIEAIAEQYNITDPLLKEIFLQNTSGNSVFLSHSSNDKEFIKKLIVFLKYGKGGVEAYVDWQDPAIPPETDVITARRLKERISGANRFIYVATTNSLKSVWCSWELGFADKAKGVNSIAILAVKPNNGRRKKNEYLQQYPWIQYDIGNNLFLVKMPDGSTQTLAEWVL